MKTISSSKIKGDQGFTLIELLVVITIIGLLAGFMFPVASGVQRKAEKAAAENTAHNVKNSIAAYFTEYRKYPVKGANGNDTTLETENTLMDVLLASDKSAARGGLNPRKIVFFSGRKARPAGGGKFRKGVSLASGGAGKLWDPYAQHYRVTMDTDYNNRIESPSWDSNSSNDIPTTVLVWSIGRDESEQESADNIKTW